MNSKRFSTSTPRCGSTSTRSYLREGYQMVPSGERSFDQAERIEPLYSCARAKRLQNRRNSSGTCRWRRRRLLNLFKAVGATREILTEEGNTVKDSNLRNLLFLVSIKPVCHEKIVPWRRTCLRMDLFVYCDANLRCQSASRMVCLIFLLSS